MTNWKLIQGSQSTKPTEVDTHSSPTTVYLRRNIEQIEVEDEMGKTTMWQYEEREMTKEEYSQYLIVQESTEAITSFQEQTVIDKYTEELILGGVL